ncbi:MAG: helix-turn-helix domain-containing protein [Streptococcaceae bacterium]|jgi:putative transcriptional regulator|nr:helix-turn-helix domain-containing protein [Streptococcaceae bacterium]
MQAKLYALRKEMGYTQSEVAKAINISTNAYLQKEKGSREFTLTEMFNIANFFNKELCDIFQPRNITK